MKPLIPICCQSMTRVRHWRLVDIILVMRWDGDGDLLDCHRGTGALGEKPCVTWTMSLHSTFPKSEVCLGSNLCPQDYESSDLATGEYKIILGLLASKVSFRLV